MTKTTTAFALAALVASAAPALAQSKGDMTLGFGIHNVMPQGGNSTTAAGLLNVDDNARPTLTFEYFIADRVGVEVLAAYPFEHDINLAGTGKVAKTKHLPPTISLQYHFVNNSTVTPFVGIGINYTTFFDTDGVGALAGTSVSLDDSWGLAAHAGLDFKVSEHGSLRLDARYMNIETDVKVGGAKIGKVNIDPLVVGVAYVHRF
ncbi:outer membrane beta-barrel protein [Roseovarius aestuarii]|nr:outer membrane beta-barrel protein [Roseovarius aestuarii]